MELIMMRRNYVGQMRHSHRHWNIQQMQEEFSVYKFMLPTIKILEIKISLLPQRDATYLVTYLVGCTQVLEQLKVNVSSENLNIQNTQQQDERKLIEELQHCDL